MGNTSSYSLVEVAKFLNISLVTAKRWKKSGKIPAPAEPRSRPQRWSYDQVTALIQQQTNRGK